MGFQRRQSGLAVLGVGVAVSVTIAMAAIEWHFHQTVLASAQWVTHTLDVERHFDALLTTVVDAETSQRGFLLVSDVAYLAPYRAATAGIDAQLADLKTLTADNDVQQARLAHLATLIGAKVADLNESMDLAAAGQRDAGLAIVASQRRRDSMDQIRQAVHDGLADEQRLLVRRAADLKADVNRSEYLVWGLVAANAVGLVALLLTMARLRKLEPMVTVCAWSKTIQFEDEWITFEEYLWRRFHIRVSHGMSPEQTAMLMAELDRTGSGR